jgi:hypothetical protein
MLACLSHASRWTPENDSHPVGAEALQCLTSMLAAEGAAYPPDLSGFTAKEAREVFPCLREWSECFTVTLITHARKLTHEKAKRPREDDAAVSLSQVERARNSAPSGGASKAGRRPLTRGREGGGNVTRESGQVPGTGTGLARETPARRGFDASRSPRVALSGKAGTAGTTARRHRPRAPRAARRYQRRRCWQRQSAS